MDTCATEAQFLAVKKAVREQAAGTSNSLQLLLILCIFRSSYRVFLQTNNFVFKNSVQ
jgi:hypothetical protein